MPEFLLGLLIGACLVDWLHNIDFDAGQELLKKGQTPRPKGPPPPWPPKRGTRNA